VKSTQTESFHKSLELDEREAVWDQARAQFNHLRLLAEENVQSRTFGGGRAKKNIIATRDNPRLIEQSVSENSFLEAE